MSDSMAGSCPTLLDRESQFDENGFPFCVFEPTGCDAEGEWLYRPRGLPPIDIGDKFQAERFTIIHKLGYGLSSTVWLAYDQNSDQHVALKMLHAEDSVSCMQTKVQDHLFQNNKPSLPPNILSIRDNFEFESPNGQHKCLVFEWAGPSLEQILGFRKIKPEIGRRLSKDIANAIKHLHDNHIAFGDLSTSNILMRLKRHTRDEATALVEDLIQNLQIYPLRAYDGREAWAHHGPKNVYSSIEPEDFQVDMLVPEITLVDLNEAVVLGEEANDTANQEASAVHLNVAAPEYIFGLNKRHTKSSDISSLAHCFFEIRASKALITRGDPDEIGCDMVELLGHPPQSWINLIRSSPEHIAHGILSAIDDIEKQGNQTLESRIRAIGDWSPLATMTWDERRHFYIERYGMDFANDPVSGYVLRDYPPPPAKLSDEEAHDFHNLLSKMLCYNPDERITIDEVLAHSWLNRSYDDLDAPAEWLSGFSEFRNFCAGVPPKSSQTHRSSEDQTFDGPSDCETRCIEKLNKHDERSTSTNMDAKVEEATCRINEPQEKEELSTARSQSLAPVKKDDEGDSHSEAGSDRTSSTISSVFSVESPKLADSGHLDQILTVPQNSHTLDCSDESASRAEDKSAITVHVGK